MFEFDADSQEPPMLTFLQAVPIPQNDVVILGMVSMPATDADILRKLSVFADTFNGNDAAALLSCSVGVATSTLRSMSDRGLLLLAADCSRHSLHQAMKQQCRATPELQSYPAFQRNYAYTVYMLQQLKEWSTMFITPAFADPFRLIRLYAADLDEVWRLLSTDIQLAAACCVEAAAAVNQHLEVLLYNSSLASSAVSAWQALSHASTCRDMEEIQATFKSMIAHESLWVKRNLDSAHAMLCDVVAVRKRRLGSQHPDTLCSVYNLAWCLYNMARPGEAETMLVGLIKMQEQSPSLGAAHHDTMRSKAALASCFNALYKNQEALDLTLKVLADKRRVLGSEHPSTLSSISNTAVSLSGVGRHAEALLLFTEVVEKASRILGVNHTLSVSAKRGLASCRQ